MPLDTAAVALGDLVFGEACEKPGGWPGFPVGALGHHRPALPHGGQTQIIQQQTESRCIDGLGHAASPASKVLVCKKVPSSKAS
jgi:hypothetical protein